MIQGKVLIIDDNKSVLSALEIMLQMEFKTVEILSNPNQIKSYDGLDQFDVVLLDMNFSAGLNSGNEGLFWLKQILKKAPQVGVIMMTAYGSIELAVNALKEGAMDFVLKPWNNQKLIATIKNVYRLRKSNLQIDQLEEKGRNLTQVINQSTNQIIGASKAVQQMLRTTKKVAKTDANVLFTGENGTGKELIARALHLNSKRNKEVFISVDLGSISESLFESELFGHVKGAFTDAKEDRLGKFEVAHRGTLFLDEIGNLSIQMQAKLLTAIQSREVVRVGANKKIPVDIRLVCATNCNLNQMVADGLFREDLLYRINTIHIEVPPLRERAEDVLLLADFYLKRFAQKYEKPSLKINLAAQRKLQEYQWPGNIRELQHTLERAVILSETAILAPSDFMLNHGSQAKLNLEVDTLEEMERLMIQKALEKHDGNYSAAANQLGITRQTLYNKIKKHD